jgi:hypothetical protein
LQLQIIRDTVDPDLPESRHGGSPMPQCPQPFVYADDTDLRALGTAELLVVATLRLWVAEQTDAVGLPDWRAGFTAARIDRSGVRGFIGLLHLAARARGVLDVRPPQCRRLGRDEGLLLRLISLAQNRRLAAAGALLAEWLPPAAARLAARRLDAFARALAEVGLGVPLRHAEAASLAGLAACAHAMPGLALLQ